MAEYIEREAAYEDFEKCNSENPKWTPSRVKALIARQKSADVATVRRGRWRGFTNPRFCGLDDSGDPIYRDGVLYYCSECARKTVIKERYCPNCGAKMDLEAPV